MGGSVLSFLKAEWKVSDTDSTHWPSNDYWCTIWIQSSFLFLRSLIYSVSHEVLLVKALFCGGIHTGFLMGTTIMHYIKGHPRNITAIFVVKMAYWFYIRSKFSSQEDKFNIGLW
jgi:hypothetical protein